MDRRKFLKTGAGTAAAGALLSGGLGQETAAAGAPKPRTPAVLADYSAKDHRRRLENIARCQRGVRRAMRTHLVTDYLPGHCVYNLGEYPCLKPWDPNGPHSYGWWDSVPGRPAARPTHRRWLAQYLPMVEEGTWAWLEIGESDLFTAPLSEQVVASAFANRDLYLVLANYGTAEAEVATTDAYVGAETPSAPPQKQWKLPGRSLRILRRSA